MTCMERNQQRRQALKELIGLRFSPVAMKLLAEGDEIPADALRPRRDLKRHIALCQAFAMARRQNTMVYMDKYDHWCWNPLLTYGMVPFEPESQELRLIASKMGIQYPDKAKDFVEAFPRIAYGTYTGLLIAPLEQADFAPDILLIYCRNNMLGSLLMAVNSQSGDMVESRFAPLDSCCYGVVPPLQEGSYRITFPDPGERCRAAVEADAVIFTVPKQKMDEFFAGVALENRLGFTPESMVPELSGDFARPPFYNSLFLSWGLDTGEDWSVPMRETRKHQGKSSAGANSKNREDGDSCRKND